MSWNRCCANALRNENPISIAIRRKAWPASFVGSVVRGGPKRFTAPVASSYASGDDGRLNVAMKLVRVATAASSQNDVARMLLTCMESAFFAASTASAVAVPSVCLVKKASRCLIVRFIMSSLSEMMNCKVSRSTAPSLVIMNSNRREYTDWLMIGPMKCTTSSPAPGDGENSATCLCAVFMDSQIIGSTTKRIKSLSPMPYRGLPLTFKKPMAKMYVKLPMALYTV